MTFFFNNFQTAGNRMGHDTSAISSLIHGFHNCHLSVVDAALDGEQLMFCLFRLTSFLRLNCDNVRALYFFKAIFFNAYYIEEFY